jgi:hypothetical protein
MTNMPGTQHELLRAEGSDESPGLQVDRRGDGGAARFGEAIHTPSQVMCIRG